MSERERERERERTRERERERERVCVSVCECVCVYVYVRVYVRACARVLEGEWVVGGYVYTFIIPLSFISCSGETNNRGDVGGGKPSEKCTG